MVRRVDPITCLGRSGISGWLMQRVSALIMAAYVIFMIVYFAMHPQISFVEWKALLNHAAMRIFNVITLLALLGHAWIGIWTVLTDYIKCSYTRGTLEVLMILALLACLVWGVQIFWSL